MQYRQSRTRGGLKGLGTGARSAIKGRSRQKTKFQRILQTIPNDGRRMKPESKVVDTLEVTSTFQTAPTVTYLNLVQEGAGFFNRVGRKICMKSLYITGNIEPNGTNAAAQIMDYNRIIVFYDRQANGTTITVPDILQSQDQTGATSNTVYDGINMNNRERFIILMDRRIVTPAIGINGVTPTNTTLQTNVNEDGNDSGFKVTRYIKLQDLETHYLSTANPVTIANITTGALGIFTISTASGTARAWNLLWTARLKFYDV